MLRARSEPGTEERGHEKAYPRARACQAVADARQCRSQRQNGSRAKTLGEKARWNLEACHRPGEQRAEQAELRIADPELLLPQRQQHVDQIGVSIVKRVGAKRHARHPTLSAPRRNGCRILMQTVRVSDGHVHLACDTRTPLLVAAKMKRRLHGIKGEFFICCAGSRSAEKPPRSRSR